MTDPSIQQAVEAVEDSVRETLGEAIARRRATGWRYVCSFCKSDLPGSTPDNKLVSHGMCEPACAEAEKMGYGKKKPTPTPSRHDPLGPIFEQL